MTIELLEEGGYLATNPVWDDLLAQGRTIGEALEIAQNVARRLIESYLERGDPLPEAVARSMAQARPPYHAPIHHGYAGGYAVQKRPGDLPGLRTPGPEPVHTVAYAAALRLAAKARATIGCPPRTPRPHRGGRAWPSRPA